MTKIDVFNLAMTSIGELPIEDVANYLNSTAGQACELWWKPTLKTVQGLVNWAELDRSARIYPTGKRDERGAEYNKPENCLKFIGIVGRRDGDGIHEEGQFVYLRGIEFAGTDFPKYLFVKYQALEENPDLWSSELLSCVVELLAANVFTAVTKQDASNLKEHFWQITYPRLSSLHLRRIKPSRNYIKSERLK